MKKFLVVLLMIALLLQVGGLWAYAEGTEGTSTTAVTVETTTTTVTTTTATEGEGGGETTTTTDTTTTTTEGEGTDPTDPPAFEATAEAVVEGDLLKITYVATGDAVPTALAVAGSSYPLSVDAENAVATMKYDQLPLGTHPATLVFAEGSCALSYPGRTGTAKTLMQIRAEGNNVVAKLYFAHNRVPIPVVDVTISIQVDGRDYTPQKTDENGEALFAGVLISQKTSQVTCVFVECTADGVTYEGATGRATISAQTTTSSSATTTAVTRPTGSQTTASRVEGSDIPTVTYPTVYGSLTTAVQAEDAVLTDVIADTELLSKLGLADGAAFAAKVKAVIPKGLYETATAEKNAPIFVKLLTSPIAVTPDMLAAAVASEAALKDQNAENSVMLTFSFSLQAVGEGVDSELNLGKSESPVLLKLPRPETMSACTQFYLLKTGVTSLLEAQAVSLNGDVLELPLSENYTYTLAAFYQTEKAPTKNGGQNVIITVLMIVLVVGIVLFIGVALLLYWPHIRVLFGKEKPAGKPIPEEIAEEDDAADAIKVLPPEPMFFSPETGDLPAVQTKKSDDE